MPRGFYLWNAITVKNEQDIESPEYTNEVKVLIATPVNPNV
jgi:hypothetical protein